MIFALFACTGQNLKNFESLNPTSFLNLLNKEKNAVLIDVRTPEEFSIEKIEKAININWNNSNFETEIEKINKNKAVFLYCKAGSRSSQAAQKLKELGFLKVYNLEGGILKWNALGLGKSSSKKTGMTLGDYNKLTNNKKPVLIDFYAKWCGPCKKMAPYLEKMKITESNTLEIIKLDADEHKTLCEQLKIEGLPTLLYFKNGQEIWKHTGYISETNLKSKIANVK